MNYKNIHFIGIGGIGMSGLAQILNERGFNISGSDIAANNITESLKGKGIKIFIGHKPENIDNADVIVVSSAISINNPEVKTAIKKGIPIMHRSEMLAKLMENKKGIAIAGTHGKTTTTSMISLILDKVGYDPTIIVGGIVPEFESNAKNGNGDFVVAEADESDGSLIRLRPFFGIITNIEADHLDYYSGIGDIKKVFEKFLALFPNNGYALLNYDDNNVKDIIKTCHNKYITYGLNNGVDFKASNIVFHDFGSTFTIVREGVSLEEISLSVPGIHNIYNALAATALGISLGIKFDDIRSILSTFKGVKRRFQIIGKNDQFTIIDDYAHHPTEIMATLSAARKIISNNRLISIFQPHRYTRTKYFYDDFGKAFFNSDIVIITDIYPAGEENIPQVTSKLIVDSLKKYGHNSVWYIPNIQEVPEFITNLVESNDTIITIGAGDIWKVGKILKEKLISS